MKALYLIPVSHYLWVYLHIVYTVLSRSFVALVLFSYCLLLFVHVVLSSPLSVCTILSSYQYPVLCCCSFPSGIIKLLSNLIWILFFYCCVFMTEMFSSPPSSSSLSSAVLPACLSADGEATASLHAVNRSASERARGRAGEDSWYGSTSETQPNKASPVFTALPCSSTTTATTTADAAAPSDSEIHFVSLCIFSSGFVSLGDCGSFDTQKYLLVVVDPFLQIPPPSPCPPPEQKITPFILLPPPFWVSQIGVPGADPRHKS